MERAFRCLCLCASVCWLLVGCADPFLMLRGGRVDVTIAVSIPDYANHAFPHGVVSTRAVHPATSTIDVSVSGPDMQTISQSFDFAQAGSYANGYGTIECRVTGVRPGEDRLFDVSAKDGAGNVLTRGAATATVGTEGPVSLSIALVPYAPADLTLEVGATGSTAYNGMTYYRVLLADPGTYRVFLTSDQDVDLYVCDSAGVLPAQSSWVAGAPTAEQASVTTTESGVAIYPAVFGNTPGVQNEYTLIATADSAPPAPGATGAIAFLERTASSVVVGWSRATDGMTSQPDLVYKVVRSTTASIGTVADAEANGTVVQDWTPDIDGITARDLAPATVYSYNVIVRDKGGNKAAYGARPAAYLMAGALQGLALSLSGAVTTMAGQAGAYTVADGTGTAARFYGPVGITSDGWNLYVSEQNNHTIRRIVIATAAVTTLAGQAGVPGTADGTGPAAQFNGPSGITTDGTSLYIADTYNDTIRRIVIATSAVTTFAGLAGASGAVDDTGAAARFNWPGAITTDGANLYVADTYNHSIRRIEIATATVTTLAGQAGASGTADGTGPIARFNLPGGITTDGRILYVSEFNNHTIRRIEIATAAVTTLAGLAGVPGTADDTGTAARFNSPLGITTDGANVYVADYFNHTIRTVVIATTAVVTLAGQGGVSGSADGTGTAAQFYRPGGIVADGSQLYVADWFNNTIRGIQ